MAERERRIQEIAYLLWEGEGRPDGQAERFWHMAEAAYEAEAEMTGGGTETPQTEAATILADAAEVEAAPVVGSEAPEALAAGKRADKPKALAADKGKAAPGAKPAKATDVKAVKAEAPAVAKAVEADPPAKSAAKPKAKKGK